MWKINLSKSTKTFSLFFAVDVFYQVFFVLGSILLANYFDDYIVGSFFNVLVLVNFLVVFITLGSGTYLGVEYTRQKGHLEQLSSKISTYLVINGIISFTVVSIFSYFNGALLGVDLTYFILLPVLGYFISKNNVALSKFRFSREVISYGLYRLLPYVVFILGIIFIFFFSINKRFLAILLTYSIGFVFLNLKSNGLRLSFNLQKLYEMLLPMYVFGFAVAIHSFLIALRGYLEKYYITKYLSVELSGVHSMIVQVGGLYVFFIIAVVKNIAPDVFLILKKDNATSVVRRKIPYIVFLVLILTIVFYFGSMLFYSYALPEKFQIYKNNILIMHIGLFFFFLYQLITLRFFYLRKTQYIALNSLINVGLTVLLFQSLGVGSLENVFIVGLIVNLVNFLVALGLSFRL